MRTFHVGGVASSSFKQPIIKAETGGTVVYKDVRSVKDADGNFVALNKKGSIAIRDKNGLELKSYNLVMGSAISIPDGENVKKRPSFRDLGSLQRANSHREAR